MVGTVIKHILKINGVNTRSTDASLSKALKKLTNPQTHDVHMLNVGTMNIELV